MLAAVAVLLILVGVGIVWTSDSSADDPGVYRPGQVDDLCAVIDVSALAELTPTVDSQEAESQDEENLSVFGCQMRLLAEQDDDTGDYLAVTLDAKARIGTDVAVAEDAFAGAVDYERSRGRSIDEPAGSGDEAAFVTVPPDGDQQECRVHVRHSNAVLSVTMFVTGAGLDCAESDDVLLGLTTSTLDVIRSE